MDQKVGKATFPRVGYRYRKNDTRQIECKTEIQEMNFGKLKSRKIKLGAYDEYTRFPEHFVVTLRCDQLLSLISCKAVD